MCKYSLGLCLFVSILMQACMLPSVNVCLNPPQVDCVASDWSAWGCDAQCNGFNADVAGTAIRTRTIVQEVFARTPARLAGSLASEY